MKYALLALLIIIILLGVFTCPPKSTIAADVYDVVRVVDGDTFIARIDAQNVRVRLIGVDTPESVHPNKAVEHFALEASAFLKGLLEGEQVYFIYDQNNAATNHKDRYDRMLAYAYRASDSLFINAEIIRQGYGHAYSKYPFTLMEDFIKYERNARHQNLGLWAETEDYPAVSDSLVWFNAGNNKYHREICRYTTDKSLSMSKTEAIAKGFEPCKVCKP
ncbi:MAG: thermonuclease family protein [Candidatus Cloacimonadaceae bacterium]|jgi:micrococcal nuclease|nr:thermonuclease family protein [Candidatus Cloacimonadaceae bacterium]